MDWYIGQQLMTGSCILENAWRTQTFLREIDSQIGTGWPWKTQTVLTLALNASSNFQPVGRPCCIQRAVQAPLVAAQSLPTHLNTDNRLHTFTRFTSKGQVKIVSWVLGPCWFMLHPSAALRLPQSPRKLAQTKSGDAGCTLHYITLPYLTLHYITLHTYIHTYTHEIHIYIHT